MKRTDLEKAINFLNIDMKSISTTIQLIIIGLLNIIETIFQNKEELKEKNQKLQDEINHLKGEQGKPDIKGKNNNSGDSNISDTNNNNNNNILPYILPNNYCMYKHQHYLPFLLNIFRINFGVLLSCTSILINKGTLVQIA